jgi:membrane fusion protein (multidrug efflux system)
MKHVMPLVIVLCAVGCKPPAEAAAAAGKKPELVAVAPVKVQTAEVTHQLMPTSLTLTGTVMADKQSEVAANVMGVVRSVHVERGSPVKAGQVLAVVDSRGAALQAAAAAAQSQASQTQSALASRDCERVEKLHTDGTISRADYDRLKTQCTAQMQNAAAALANADLAKKLAGDTVIRAPISGIVGERYINVGEYVQLPTRVASIYNINPARVSMSVPEPAVGLVKVGQTIKFEVSSWPGRQFEGTVRFMSPVLRPNTRDLIVEASAVNDDNALRPGMFAMSHLVISEEDQPTVPAGAILTDGTTKRMFLARNGQAFELVVRTGVQKDGRVAVMEPLAPGDKVILAPPPGLHDGSSIQ